MSLQDKRIVLGISGGIAAYKTPDLVRKLIAAGAQVRVVLTDSASEFVSELSLQAVSTHPVSRSLLDPAAELAMGHIELAKWADAILIAPATANIMAKLSCGIADDLLTTICLATAAPIMLAPAMNQQMWRAQVTQENAQTLQRRGVVLLGPAQGEQACGDNGPGRMLEPADLVSALTNSITNDDQLWAGKTILITAGPTQEAIDPVRYLTNRSSGKMGYALASAAAQMGAKVVLVSGPVSLPTPAKVERMDVTSALEMHQRVMEKAPECDVFIACAAVADYRPVVVADQKIKKKQQDLTLTFTKNPDIVSDVAALQNSRPWCVGFAAETQNVAEYAQQKMANKGLDMIAANDVSTPGIGFNSDDNALTVYWKNGEQRLEQASKTQLAKQLLTLIDQEYKNNDA